LLAALGFVPWSALAPRSHCRRRTSLMIVFVEMCNSLQCAPFGCTSSTPGRVGLGIGLCRLRP